MAISRFFLETLGCRVQTIDYAPTNYNGLQGVKLLKKELSSSVEIHEIDLDAQFILPQEKYGLVFFLGILYHLKKSLLCAGGLAKASKYCVISTRIAKFGTRNAEYDTSSATLSPDRANGLFTSSNRLPAR